METIAPRYDLAAKRAARTIDMREGRQTMRGVKKQDLPTKTCATCGRPFTWRKKWAKDWDEVRYCSDRCRTHRHDATPLANSARRSGRHDG